MTPDQSGDPLPLPGKTAASADRSVTLAELTIRIGAEMDHLTCLSLQMQAALPGAAHMTGHTPQDLAGLQRIDRITQTLADLARLMTVIVPHVPSDAKLPLAPLQSAVILHDLSLRLFNSAHHGQIRKVPAGEVHWL